MPDIRCLPKTDGSVLAMLHSVVATIEVKTRLYSKHIGKMWSDAVEITSLANEVEGYGGDTWEAVQIYGFAYACANRLETLERKYELEGKPDLSPLDITLLRLHPQDAIRSAPFGVQLHFEPDFKEKNSEELLGYFPMSMPSLTPLNDLYYNLIQNSYYILGERDHGFSDIGRYIMSYMSWSSFQWDKYFDMKEKEKKPQEE